MMHTHQKKERKKPAPAPPPKKTHTHTHTHTQHKKSHPPPPKKKNTHTPALCNRRAHVFCSAGDKSSLHFDSVPLELAVAPARRGSMAMHLTRRAGCVFFGMCWLVFGGTWCFCGFRGEPLVWVCLRFLLLLCLL